MPKRPASSPTPTTAVGVSGSGPDALNPFSMGIPRPRGLVRGSRRLSPRCLNNESSLQSCTGLVIYGCRVLSTRHGTRITRIRKGYKRFHGLRTRFESFHNENTTHLPLHKGEQSILLFYNSYSCSAVVCHFFATAFRTPLCATTLASTVLRCRLLKGARSRGRASMS